MSGSQTKAPGFAEGYLRDGTKLPDRTVPADVHGLTSAVAAISTGFVHTCDLTYWGVVKCWGADWDGQLGDGTADEGRAVPMNVVGFP